MPRTAPKPKPNPKPPIRLEKQTGSSKRLWQVQQIGARLVIRSGTSTGAARETSETCDDAKSAVRRAAELVDKKTKEGYAAVAPVAEPFYGKKIQARAPELEATIQAAPDDAEGYLVYADWLQSRADPRGELILVQHALSLDPDSTRSSVRARALLEDHHAQLLGPLAKLSVLPSTYSQRWGLRWRWGFIHAARLYHRFRGRAPLTEQLVSLLQHPSGALLRMLLMGRLDDGYREVVELLSKHAPRTLTSVHFDEDNRTIGDIGGLWRAMPQLEHLWLRGGGAQVGDIEAPNLTMLGLDMTDAAAPLLSSLARARFPALASLQLRFVSVEAADNHLVERALQDADRFPALTRLELGTSSPSPGLLASVLASPLIRRLQRLALHLELSEAVLAVLVNAAPRLAKIPELVIPRDPNPPPYWRGKDHWRQLRAILPSAGGVAAPDTGPFDSD